MAPDCHWTGSLTGNCLGPRPAFIGCGMRELSRRGVLGGPYPGQTPRTARRAEGGRGWEEVSGSQQRDARGSGSMDVEGLAPQDRMGGKLVQRSREPEFKGRSNRGKVSDAGSEDAQIGRKVFTKGARKQPPRYGRGDGVLRQAGQGSARGGVSGTGPDDAQIGRKGDSTQACK